MQGGHGGGHIVGSAHLGRDHPLQPLFEGERDEQKEKDVRNPPDDVRIAGG